MPQSFTRKNLPHWYMPFAHHFITFRLAESLPQDTLKRMELRKKELLSLRLPNEQPFDHRTRVHKTPFAEYDEALHSSVDRTWLSDPRIASLVRNRMRRLQAEGSMTVNAYSIMPNHVHMLVRFPEPPATEADFSDWEPGESKQRGKTPMSEAMNALKGGTAYDANIILGRMGPFWQPESYDHWVRDEDELERILLYINANAVKAGLAMEPMDFFWCSAHERYLLDGDKCGWLPDQGIS